MNREKLERQLEEVVWQDREFERHKAWLKAAVVEVVKKEKKTSWLKMRVVLLSMSKFKKIVVSTLSLVLVVIGVVLSCGKITGRAVAEDFIEYIRGFSFTFKDLSKHTRVTMSENFWQRLQDRVKKSHEAKDLHHIDSQTLDTIHFNSDGTTDGKSIPQKLDLWEFTYDDTDEDGSIKMHVTLGYDENKVPQYFSEMVEADTSEDKKLQAFYNEYYQAALAAPDVQEVAFRIRVLSPEEISKYIQPELNESADKIDYSSPRVDRSLIYTFDSVFGRVEGTQGLNETQEVTKILRFFSNKDGHIIDVFICKDAIPCGINTNATKLEMEYLKAFNMLPKDIWRSIQMNATWIQSGDGEGGVKIAIVPRGSEKEYEESFREVLPQWFKDLKVPQGYHYLLIDKYGMPHDMLEILKNKVPDLKIVVVK